VAAVRPDAEVKGSDEGEASSVNNSTNVQTQSDLPTKQAVAVRFLSNTTSMRGYPAPAGSAVARDLSRWTVSDGDTVEMDIDTDLPRKRLQQPSADSPSQQFRKKQKQLGLSDVVRMDVVEGEMDVDSQSPEQQRRKQQNPFDADALLAVPSAVKTPLGTAWARRIARSRYRAPYSTARRTRVPVSTSDHKRRLTNVARGTQPTDAVNKGQLVSTELGHQALSNQWGNNGADLAGSSPTGIQTAFTPPQPVKLDQASPSPSYAVSPVLPSAANGSSSSPASTDSKPVVGAPLHTDPVAQITNVARDIQPTDTVNKGMADSDKLVPLES
ncbi:hypothetical protein DFQ30_004807, partial [Apophysomyces sp. BC1015]